MGEGGREGSEEEARTNQPPTCFLIGQKRLHQSQIELSNGKRRMGPDPVFPLKAVVSLWSLTIG